MDLTIKKATAEDAEHIARVLTEAMNYKLSLGDESWSTEPYTQSEVLPLVDKGLVYVLKIQGQIVGTFQLHQEDKMIWSNQPANSLYLHQFAMDDKNRGHGLGKQIILWAYEEAYRQGKKFLRLDVLSDNTELRQYYEKLGFKHVGHKEFTEPPRPHTSLLYEMPILRN